MTLRSEDARLDGLPPQLVLILVGLIGSGKSTFAEALQRHVPQFRRCNQDELGDRRAVEQLARSSLRGGMSVCIDRTNFDAAQRSHWISIAREVPGHSVPVWIIWFDTPYNICAERIQARLNHPTIKDANTGLQVLRRFSSQFCPPSPHEGHERVLRFTPSDHPSAEYSREDVVAILERLYTSPPIDSSGILRQAPITSSFQGPRGRGVNRGWGSHRGHRGRGFSQGFQRGRGSYGRGSEGGHSTWHLDPRDSRVGEPIPSGTVLREDLGATTSFSGGSTADPQNFTDPLSTGGVGSARGFPRGLDDDS